MNSFKLAREFLGKEVSVIIDRPLGSKHHKHGFIYETNYGHIPKTKSADGEELDAYYLGVDKPLKKAKGVCVAIIHRTNDDDDKLVVVSKDNKDIADEEIDKLTEFQEKWFEHVIVREDPNLILKYREKLPYRKGVIGFIADDKGEILLIQSHAYRENDWRQPGGGVDEGETHEEALLRELLEELGSSKFEIVKESKHINKYDWPDNLVVSDVIKKDRVFRGQEQKQFLVKFSGIREEITIQEEELRAAKWVKVDDLKEHLNFKDQWKLSERVLKEFGLM